MGGVEDVRSVLTLVRRGFAMSFVKWSSGNSSRWKRKTVTDRRKRKKQKVEKVESKRMRHVDDHGDGGEMRSELEP